MVQGAAPEKYRCTAQTDRQLHLLRAGQNNAKSCAISHSKTAGHPIGPGIGKIQNALKTGDTLGALRKSVDHNVDLFRFRCVFGIINSDDAAPTMIKGFI